MTDPPEPPTPAPAPEAGIDRFLDELEAPAPAPSGGTAAATAAAMAAALIVMVGRGSPGWKEGAGVAAQARSLRARLVRLAERDTAAYATVLSALRGVDGSAEREFALGQALIGAAEVPLQIADAAADVAELAALAAVEGKETLRPDAVAAATLAEAAARASAHLVEINLATVPGDDRSGRVAELAAAAEAARARALGTQ